MILQLTLQQQLPAGVTEDQVKQWYDWHWNGSAISVGENPLIDDNYDLELDTDNIVKWELLKEEPKPKYLISIKQEYWTFRFPQWENLMSDDKKRIIQDTIDSIGKALQDGDSVGVPDNLIEIHKIEDEPVEIRVDAINTHLEKICNLYEQAKDSLNAILPVDDEFGMEKYYKVLSMLQELRDLAVSRIRYVHKEIGPWHESAMGFNDEFSKTLKKAYDDAGRYRKEAES